MDDIYILKRIITHYLTMQKLSASWPEEINRSLYSNPCRVRSSRDMLPRRPSII
jgi:hypothetical protein